MISKYLLPEDDGLPIKTYGPWTKDKLYYLERYLNIFTTGMRNQPVRGFTYIDLFAGPGKINISGTDEVVLGSPLLAISQRNSFTEYHLVEIERTYYEALEQRVGHWSESGRVSLYNDDANRVANEIVEHIMGIDKEYLPGIRSTLNLAFIDPEGLQAKWKIVEKLAEPYSMDLVIHYPVMALNRTMGNALRSSGESEVDEFFGDYSWREIFQGYADMGSPQSAHRELIDHYRQKLLVLGYAEVKVAETEPLMQTDLTKAPLYRLVFASKHERGHEFWEKISKKGPTGQLRLL